MSARTVGADGRRRPLLDDLLVTALDRAVALAEMDPVALAIDRDLDLDVAVVLEPRLEIQGVVAEGGLRLGPTDPQRGLELTSRADHPHPLPAPAGRRLDEDRIADPLRLGERMEVVAQHAVRARDRRQPIAAQERPRPGLAREAVEDLRRRPDEHEPVGPDGLGEVLVLGQEAVARVDRLAARHERRADDRRRREVGPPRVRRSDADRLVGESDRQRVAVRLAVRDHGLDPELTAGPQDPEGDLAPVRDQDPPEHQVSTTARATPSAPSRATSG